MIFLPATRASGFRRRFADAPLGRRTLRLHRIPYGKAVAYGRARVRPLAEGLPTGLDFGAQLIAVNGQHAYGAK